MMQTMRQTTDVFRKGSGERGWTLIELLIVISLIMILAAISLNSYRNSIWAAKEAALRSNLYHMRESIDQYYADKQRYPESLETLVSEGYIRTVPEDPFTDSTTTWQTVPAPSMPGQLTGSPGIYDVKSGADHVSLDGSRVADW
jgi:general secretion pathway protein G